MRYYHGTTMENFKIIQKKGFVEREEKNWNCSDSEMFYFFKEELDDDPHRGFYMAFESATINAAVENQLCENLGLIVIDADEIAEKYIEPDNSCSGMDYSAIQIEIETLNQMIREGHITVNFITLDNAYMPGFRFFYIPRNNEYMDYDYLFTSTELKCMNIIEKNDCYIWEDLMETAFYEDYEDQINHCQNAA